jgi:hypothetical protein
MEIIPHLLAKALEHLPNLYPAMMGSDYASQKIMQEGKGNPHAFIDAILATTENMIVEAPVISSLVEKTSNKYNETELSLKNPYSYMGYIGAVKDIEALTGVEKKAPEYLLTTPEKYYNRAGLMWLVPNKKDAKQRAEKEKQDAHGKAQKIKEEFPEFFKR